MNHNSHFTEIIETDTGNTFVKKQEQNITNGQNSVKSTVCVTVNGTLFYVNSANQYVVLPNATVEIWEEDNLWDDYLTSTITDQNGHFSVYLCDDDGLFDSHLELYAVPTTVNSRVSVLNYTQPGTSYGFSPFKWATWVVATSGGTVSYGNILIDNGILNRGGAKIFDNMQRAWSASVTHGFNPSYTPTIYPFDCAGTSFYAFSGFANPFGNCGLGSWGTGLGAIYLETEEWLSGNEDVSNHEYGHALMHRAYSNEWYPNTGGGSHSVFPQPTGFAWSEGWATFYTQIVNNDGNYNGWGNLETKSSIPNSTTGEVNEWRVAQALVDLWDTNVDGEDNSHILYSKFISTMQSNNSNNLTTFWSQLKNTLPSWEKYFGSKSLIYNTIPVVLESYTFLSVSISGPTSLEFKQQGTWTANVSGGSGSHTYKWYRSSDGGSSWGGVIGTSSTFTTTMLFNDFVLRCDILDTQTNETDSDTHNVEYFDGLPKKASDVQERPNSYALNSNYPNPFNPTTTIKYQLKENGFVSLKVFDLLGKEVASLVNENKSAGFYETVFDASDLTSGLYIYKLTVNGFVSTKKMLLTK